MRINIFFAIFMLFVFPGPLHANDLEKQVRKIKLDNGLTVLLIHREGAPVFSAYIRVKVGNIEEPAGSSGLAHFFEHMAFKGTPEIGVRDYPAEEQLLNKMHALGTEIVSRRKNGELEENLKPLEDKLHALEAEHQKLIVQNEFVQIYQRNGGSDMNATTSNDFTSYFVSLPSNKLELWAHLETERLLHPVLREFYKERDVVTEERRMRSDTDPDGRLYEAFLSTAFDNSPYGINVIGIPEDIRNYTYEAAMAFRKKYYIPSRMVVAIAGNFDSGKTEKIVKKYFGRLQSAPDEATKIPSQNLDATFPREKVISGKDEPRFYIGFHRPAYPHPDDEVFDVVESLLCDGRTTRLFSDLVIQKKMASTIDCYAALPAGRLDSLFAVYAIPSDPFTNRQVEREILNQLERLKNEKVTLKELEKVKNQVDADLVWSLKSNMGLAGMLSYFESLSGDWKYIYTLRERIHQINADDVMRVAQTYFVSGRQVSVYLEKE